jgi:hypothetical protein
VNGLVLDTSALLQYASGRSIEPGLMLTLADEDTSQEVWVPAVCLAQAHLDLAGSPEADTLEVLTAGRHDIRISVLDGPAARRIAAMAAAVKVGLDAAHAIATARLYRCYVVTNMPEAMSAVPELDVLDIGEGWD